MALATSPRVPSAVVRLDVRVGNARSTLYEVGDGGFLIGSVPGCDLRLPGTNLPAVICLIARHPNGASLRKLAPVTPIAVEGKPVTAAYLKHGETISVGNVEILVAIELAAGSPPASASPAIPLDLAERIRTFETRETQLLSKTRELEADRAGWLRKRDDIEAECRRQAEQLKEVTKQLRQKEADLESARGEVERREQVFHHGNEATGRREKELDARSEELTRQEAEVSALRKELGRIRSELTQKYQNRREKLLTQQEAVRKAARNVQARKQEVDQQEARLRIDQDEFAIKQAEVEARDEQFGRERQLVDEQHRLISSRQQEHQREMARRSEDIQNREQALVQAKLDLEKGQKQHQADLVRLDRIQAALEGRQKQFEQRALEIDRRFEQMQRDSRDLEEQASQLDEWHKKLVETEQGFAKQKKEIEERSAQIDQRANTLEGQQAMLVTLRSRLERMRDELRGQEQALADQRAMQEAREADIVSRLDEARRLQEAAANDKQLQDEERRRFDERRATLEQAVAQLRKTQEALERDHAEARKRQEQLDETAAAQEQQAEMLMARGQQMEEAHNRLQSDRQVMRDRESALSKAEQTLAALQEQLRKRSEEMNERQRGLEQSLKQLEQSEADHKVRVARAEEKQAQSAKELEAVRQELSGQAADLEARAEQIVQREKILAEDAKLAEEVKLSLSGQRQTLTAERIAWEVSRQKADEDQRQAAAAVDKVRADAAALIKQLPELELRTSASQEKLLRAREQMREHLAEIHGYAKQSREDLESARKQVQTESERVRQQELELEVARDEHRLAVVAFRQQLIDWQGKVGEMKQALAVGSSQLELRQAQVEEKAREVADTHARLEVEVSRVAIAKQQVLEKRFEMDRHLGDMREWYRRKLRELAGVDAPTGEPADGDVVPMPAGGNPTSEVGERDPSRAVLTLQDEIAPADRQLGELLSSLGLVDADTLHALWAEARRQRRSLRQLLLAGNYMTLHQMSLIEAGNLDGLMLGPVRVIDRLASTARESVYRVFDPRNNVEAVLRHLSESEMDDAVRPDEFRQRFSAARVVQQSNVAGVLEVLTIADRPAALVEWVRGLPSGDWPGFASAPGVWYRLVCQAAVALHAAHSAGLIHGHIDSGSFVLTPEGALKLVGLGEPGWLVGASASEESVAGDLFGLGKLAAEWAALTPAGKSSARGKPLPDELRRVLERLMSEDASERFPSAMALLEELERIGSRVQASTTAWTRLLDKVREQVPAALRQSA